MDLWLPHEPLAPLWLVNSAEPMTAFVPVTVDTPQGGWPAGLAAGTRGVMCAGKIVIACLLSVLIVC